MRLDRKVAVRRLYPVRRCGPVYRLGEPHPPFVPAHVFEHRVGEDEVVPAVCDGFGQRARIGVARALSVQPSLIICDEPISALDVSIQGQIINLLQDLQQQFDLTYLFIAHDLAVVRHISHRVMVMYLGKIAEIADSGRIYSDPRHPYTAALLSAIPVPDPKMERHRKLVQLEGEIPSPINPPSGCRFHTRCPIAQSICSEVEPPLEQKAPGHWSACHFSDQVASVAPWARASA